MEKVYLIKNRTTSIIYKLDLFGFDSTKDYKSILQCLLPQFVREHPTIMLRLNISFYQLLLYTLSKLSGYNQREYYYSSLRNEVKDTFSRSQLNDLISIFLEKYKIIGKSDVIINF